MSTPSQKPIDPNRPLQDLEHWDEFLQTVYPDPSEPGFEILKDRREFRDLAFVICSSFGFRISDF